MLVQGIPEGIAEDRIESVAWDVAVQAATSMPNAVNFAYDRQTQAFRGFATIEFPHKEASKRFVDHVSGKMKVDGHMLSLLYHHPEGRASRSPDRADRAARRFNDEPTVTLIVKGIAAHTTEATVIATFEPFAPLKDIRHFPARSFCFVQFHTVADARRALDGFESKGCSRLDGQKVHAHFAKERDDGRLGILGVERNLLHKQAMASAEAVQAEETLAIQQVQEANASKALSGVNADMWANYLRSTSQTEVVRSASTFEYDKDSGFYLDPKAGLFYDPNTTYFFTTDHKSYFLFDHDADKLCLVDKEGHKVPGGERRELPSANSSKRAEGHHSERGAERREHFRDVRDGRERGGSAALERRRSPSPSPSGRGRQRGAPRDERARGRDPSRSRERERHRQRGRDQDKGATPHPGAREAAFGAPGVGRPVAAAGARDLRPIHFPGGDPLARLAPAPPEIKAAPGPQPKKKRQREEVMGLAPMPDPADPRGKGLMTLGSVTVFSRTGRAEATFPAAPSFAATGPSLLSAQAGAGASHGPKPGFAAEAAALPVEEWICEVCMRKFSGEEALRRHEMHSDLHKQNLAKRSLGTF